MPTSRPAQSDLPANLEETGSLSQDGAQLLAVLAEYPTILSVSRFEQVTSSAGLSGTRIWRLITPKGRFALRQWPVEHPSRERLEFIHEILRHTFNRGLHLLPVPLRTRTDTSFVTHGGRFWELAPWLPGEANFESKPRPAKLADAMSVLAKFHLASASFGETGLSGSSPGLRDRMRRFSAADSTAMNELRQAIEAYSINTAIDDLARSIQAILAAARVRAQPKLKLAMDKSFALQPCLRDTWHGNLLFSGDLVTGIVDFGAMQIDSPALDVARLLGSMAGDDAEAWRLGLSKYESIRPLTPEELVAVGAADASGIVLGCINWLRWLYSERRQFGDLLAVEMRMKSLLPRLENLAAS